MTRANGLLYIARLFPDMESLDTAIAAALRALAARMPEDDATVALPDAPFLYVLSTPRPCLSSGTNGWVTPV